VRESTTAESAHTDSLLFFCVFPVQTLRIVWAAPTWTVCPLALLGAMDWQPFFEGSLVPCFCASFLFYVYGCSYLFVCLCVSLFASLWPAFCTEKRKKEQGFPSLLLPFSSSFFDEEVYLLSKMER